MRNQSENFRGGLYLFLATVLFSFMQLGVRFLEGLPVIEIVFFRSLVALIVTLVILRARRISPWGTHRKWLLLRGLCGACALYLYSIQQLPFATAISIHYLNPLLTVLLGTWFLKERARPSQWLFLLTAFLGVLLIKGYQSEVSGWGIAAGLAAGLFSASAYNIIRSLRTSEVSMVIVFYFPLVTLPLSAPGTFYYWISPEPWQWALLLAIGLLTQAAQMLLTEAFLLAPASKISVFQYSGVLLALIYGTFIFGEDLTAVMFIGALMIAGSAAASSFLGTKKPLAEIQ